MASSGNFAVFSTVTRPESGYSTSDQITGGGLSVKGPSSGSFEPCIATISPNSGKWYWEYRAGQGGGSSYGRPAIAVSEQGVVKNEDFFGGGSGQKGVLFTVNDGGKRINGSDTSYGNAVSQHDIVQIALDCDNGAVYLGINNTWQNSGDPTSGSSKTGAALTADIQNVGIDIIHTRYVGGGIDQYNFGQDDTFGGAISAAGNADENGFGVFKYSPPTGFLALCSANLSVSDDIDPAQTDDDIPTKQAGVAIWTGNGTNDTAISLGFQPDLVAIKERGATNNWYWIDSTRGVTKTLQTNGSATTHTEAGVLNAFTSTGFTIGTSGGSNNNTDTYAGWGWRANGGTTASNSNGDITSTVQANTKAGFSIVTYTGNLTSSGNSTVGHGLSKAPEFIVRKGLNVAERWAVSHVGCTSFNYMMEMNSTAAQTDKSGNGSMSAPTTTVFSNNYTDGYAVNGTNYVAYCWHGVEGYSKFGTYVGNGDADGPFIYTGFRPAIYFVKIITAVNNWFIYDKLREGYNEENDTLSFNNSTVEDNTYEHDIYSNGFKPRDSNNATNQSGQTFIYGAWADVPFKYNNAR